MVLARIAASHPQYLTSCSSNPSTGGSLTQLLLMPPSHPHHAHALQREHKAAAGKCSSRSWADVTIKRADYTQPY